MKKITTQSGTYYLIDEENQLAKRVSDTPLATAPFWSDPPNEEGFREYRLIQNMELGKNLYITYTFSDWSLSTEITSIEDVEE